MWSDIRTNSTMDQVIAKFPDNSKNHLKPLCGLPVSPYFSALKIRWLKDNVPAVKKSIKDKRCKVGTMDTWVVWVCNKTTIIGICMHSAVLLKKWVSVNFI